MRPEEWITIECPKCGVSFQWNLHSPGKVRKYCKECSPSYYSREVYKRYFNSIRNVAHTNSLINKGVPDPRHDITVTKVCAMCKKELSVKYFPLDKEKKDGLDRRCIDCNNSRQSKHRKIMKEIRKVRRLERIGEQRLNEQLRLYGSIDEGPCSIGDE